MNDDDWLEPLRQKTRETEAETQKIREECEKLRKKIRAVNRPLQGPENTL